MKIDELTKNEAYSLADFIDFNLLPYIRQDEEVDSMEWLKNIVHAYEKLCKYSGYVGVTEAEPKKGEEF